MAYKQQKFIILDYEESKSKLADLESSEGLVSGSCAALSVFMWLTGWESSVGHSFKGTNPIPEGYVLKT